MLPVIDCPRCGLPLKMSAICGPLPALTRRPTCALPIEEVLSSQESPGPRPRLETDLRRLAEREHIVARRDPETDAQKPRRSMRRTVVRRPIGRHSAAHDDIESAQPRCRPRPG